MTCESDHDDGDDGRIPDEVYCYPDPLWSSHLREEWLPACRSCCRWFICEQANVAEVAMIIVHGEVDLDSVVLDKDGEAEVWIMKQTQLLKLM